MRLSTRKFSTEQFPGQSWISALIGPLNSFMQEIFLGMQNGVTIADNMLQEVRELKFVNDAANFPISFKPKHEGRPLGLYVLYCKTSDGSAAPTSHPWLTWEMTQDGRISISNISDLTGGESYTMRVHIIWA